ncbi:hypothetical protein PSACC_01865, partial [Paramicrosporidium saccamoebae]
EMSGSKSKVVFVGNIPYEMTEEQLIDIFKEVGPVASFRLMFDRETGKARGYGFCEYADPETAASAIRNLNGYDVGGRALRVDRADQEMQSAPVPMAGGGTPSLDAVNATLAGMGNTQLLEVMTQMKTMASSNPEQTRQLLQSNPSLTYALFQAMQVMSTPTSAGQSVAPPVPNAEQQRELIMRIMSLTPEQIDALPPQQRDQVLQLVIHYPQIVNICREHSWPNRDKPCLLHIL